MTFFSFFCKKWAPDPGKSHGLWFPTCSSWGFHVSYAARLVVRESVSSPTEDIILENEVSVEVAAFRLQAIGEPLKLTDFTLWVDGETCPVDAVTVSYLDVGGSAITTSAYPDATTGLVYFAGEEVFVPASRFRATTIRIFIDSGSVGLDAGDAFQINWVDDGVKASGSDSGTIVTEGRTTDEIDGMEMVWHVSEPVFSLAAGSPSGLGTPGPNEVLRFNIVADSRGIVGVEGILFGFSGTDAAGSGWCSCASLGASAWAIYNTDDASTALGTWTFYSVDGTECSLDPTSDLGFANVDLSGEEVAAGSTNTFLVKVDSSGASPDFDDGLRLDVVGIDWTDTDSGSSTVFDETYIESLLLYGGTIYFGT